MSPETGRFDLLVAGRPSIDLMFAGLPEWPALGRDLWTTGMGMCAGTSFNTPAAVHRLGLRVGYVAMVGNDVWSGLVRAEFEAEGLPDDFLLVVDRPQPFVSVALNFDGDRGFVTYAGAGEQDEDELARAALEVVRTVPARHLHGYAGEEPPELVAAARARGMTVSLDAWGGPWWHAEASMHEIAGAADVLFANEQEALAMTGTDDVYAALARMAAHCGCVVIKRGRAGALGMDATGFAEVPAEPAQVVDTTGAGDCFNAGFLVGWLAGLPLAQSLTLGAICGARAAATFGGYRGCPRAEELRSMAAARGIALPDPPEGDEA